MPYLLPTQEIENLPGGDVIVFLTSEEHRALMAIAPQLEWISEYSPGEWKESALIKLLEAIPMSELTSILQAMSDCICNLQLQSQTQTIYGCTQPDPFTPAIGRDGNPIVSLPFDGGIMEVDENELPPINTGASTWEEWREYQCKAAEFVRRTAVLMVEGLQQIFDLPTITLAIVAAALAGVSLVALGVALPAGIFVAGVVVAIVAAMIEVGSTGGEILRDFVDDSSNTFWPMVACAMSESTNALQAEQTIEAWIDANAPETIRPLLKLFRWKQWIEQCYRGETLDGQVLDVTGITSLCVGCTPQPYTFVGTNVTDCSTFAWNNVHGVYFDAGIRCDNSQPLPWSVMDGYDGVLGVLFAEPVTCTSQFTVPVSGYYGLYIRVAGNSGEGNCKVIINGDQAGNVINVDVPPDNDNLQSILYINLDNTDNYTIELLYGKLAVSIQDNGLYLQ